MDDCTQDDLIAAWKRQYEKQHLLYTTAYAAYHAVGGARNLADMLVANEVCEMLKRRINKVTKIKTVA